MKLDATIVLPRIDYFIYKRPYAFTLKASILPLSIAIFVECYNYDFFLLRVTKYRSPKNDFVVGVDFHFLNSD